ncbi:MAG: transposase, partial [Patescibacteria group bacterium]
MGNRKHPFRTGNFYHIFNRGVEKRLIFMDASHYQEFLERLAFYQQERQPIKFSKSGFYFEERHEPFRFEIIAYALMPNHFHLLIQALSDEGVPKSLAQFLNSYTKYFNTRH